MAISCGPLLIPLRPVMRPAQHLAVFQLCYAAFAPSCNMVGFHFGQLPYFTLAGIVTQRA